LLVELAQGCLTEEAKQAYNGLIEKPLSVVDGGVTNSLRLQLKKTPVAKSKFRQNKSDNG